MFRYENPERSILLYGPLETLACVSNGAEGILQTTSDYITTFLNYRKKCQELRYVQKYYCFEDCIIHIPVQIPIQTPTNNVFY
jgi:hypothetical protein